MLCDIECCINQIQTVYETGARCAYKYRITKKHQSQVCPTCFDHCRDLFRDELSINQAIFDNIYLGTEITGDLCGMFDKTNAQW